MAKKAVIVLNGNIQENNLNKYKNIIEKGDKLIACDGGEMLVSRLSLIPDIIIGDLDSIEDCKVDYYQNKNTEIVKYPVEKNETDGELALLYCFNNAIKNIVFTNTLGGRLDHQLANLFLLEYASNLGLKAVIEEPDKEIGVITGEKEFINKEGYTFSILPLSKKVENVKNYGFKYPLGGERLYRHKTRGISNLITAGKAGLSCTEGKLLYIISKN